MIRKYCPNCLTIQDQNLKCTKCKFELKDIEINIQK
jgi:hypothetical protein